LRRESGGSLLNLNANRREKGNDDLRRFGKSKRDLTVRSRLPAKGAATNIGRGRKGNDAQKPKRQVELYEGKPATGNARGRIKLQFLSLRTKGNK